MLPRKPAELFMEMENVRAATFSMLAAVDPRAARFPHPLYGGLDLYEWPYVTILMHERDHQNQLRELSVHLREEPE